MKKLKKFEPKYFIPLVVLIVVFVAFSLYRQQSSVTDDNEQGSVNVPTTLVRSGLDVDFSKSSIDLDQILSGGPGKDGIPAITDPEFVPFTDSDVKDDVQVIYVENNGEEKLYPYNILVWHEIVNDTVGGKHLAITFCPLCGSAIVFERKIGKEVLEFGVSGFLYQSNLLMYSREDSESLWSQSLGRAVVGERTGAELAHFPLQLMTFRQAKERFPSSRIMSTDTGFSRRYDNTPYSGYSDTEATYFPVNNTDKRFPGKEVFYIVPLKGNSVAVRQNKEDGVYDVPDSDVKVTFDRGQITARWGDAEIPGYYEMWFSWATHNQETGIVLD